MSDDFTQKLPKNGNDTKILTAIQDLDTKLTKVDNRLQGLEQKFDGLEQKVDSLEKHVDERLNDTRPIWHRMVADIAQLQAGQERLEQGQLAMRCELNKVSRDQIVINDVIRRLQMDFHNMDEKLYKLTVNRNQQNSST